LHLIGCFRNYITMHGFMNVKFIFILLFLLLNSVGSTPFPYLAKLAYCF